MTEGRIQQPQNYLDVGELRALLGRSHHDDRATDEYVSEQDEDLRWVERWVPE